ncbi:MAG: hypothetical protein DWQ49_10825 [Bacteroidetes bacterium]|nr:MAG: hypothetical protein DWQ49_10825 [Bacteroidota bacterium]
MNETPKYAEIFYDYLKDVNISREEPLEFAPEAVEKTDRIVVGNFAADYVQFITPYKNKDSYVYTAFVDDIHQGIKLPELKINMYELMKDIKFEHNTPVYELGFQFRCPTPINEITMSTRLKSLYTWMKKTHRDISNSTYGGLSVDNEATIVVYPYGDKDWQTWTVPSIEEGTRQRQRLAERFNFGPPTEEGCMYSHFKDGKMTPFNYGDRDEPGFL